MAKLEYFNKLKLILSPDQYKEALAVESKHSLERTLSQLNMTDVGDIRNDDVGPVCKALSDLAINESLHSRLPMDPNPDVKLLGKEDMASDIKNQLEILRNAGKVKEEVFAKNHLSNEAVATLNNVIANREKHLEAALKGILSSSEQRSQMRKAMRESLVVKP